jgi:hypothetical protein
MYPRRLQKVDLGPTLTSHSMRHNVKRRHIVKVGHTSAQGFSKDRAMVHVLHISFVLKQDEEYVQVAQW